MDSSFLNNSDLDESFGQLLLDSDAENSDGEVDDSQADALVLCPKNDSDSSSNSTINSDDDSEGWTSDAETDNRWNFSDHRGPDNTVLMCSAPADFFELFLDDALMNLIEIETNRYGKARDPTFIETNKEELKKFIALCIQMGLVKMPSLRDYWSTRPALGGQIFPIMHVALLECNISDEYSKSLKKLKIDRSQQFYHRGPPAGHMVPHDPKSVARRRATRSSMG